MEDIVYIKLLDIPYVNKSLKTVPFGIFYQAT